MEKKIIISSDKKFKHYDELTRDLRTWYTQLEVFNKYLAKKSEFSY